MIRLLIFFLSFYLNLQVVWAEGLSFNDHNERNLVHCDTEQGVRGVFSNTVQSCIGDNTSWQNFARTWAANTIGQWGSGEIGRAYRESGSIFNAFTHKLAHGIVGAASGAALGGRGCVISGAMGAMMAETLACMMVDEPLTAKERELGRDLTYDEYESVHTRTYDEQLKHLEDVGKIAKILNVTTVFLTQQNVNVAHFAGNNAVDYNFIVMAGYAALLASAGYSAYCVNKAYQDGGAVAALQQLGIEIAINAAGIATGKFMVKAGGRLVQCDTVRQALQTVYHNIPGLERAMGRLSESIITGIEAFDRTALGQAVTRVEHNIVHLEDKLFRRVFDANTVRVRDVRWGQGIHEQGMPFEDYLATKLPEGARLPQNFKTFDYWHQPSGRAISVKTLDTQTAARLENPQHMYHTLKRNVDAIINFDYYERPAFSLYRHEILSKELYLGIPHQTHPLQRSAIDRAIDYAKLNGIKAEVFHVY